MYKRLKVKLYPTHKQQEMLDQHFDGYRFAYNLCVDYKSSLWNYFKTNISGYEMQKEFIQIRKETPWLLKCKAECIRDAALQVDNAYKRFFKGNGYPKYKSKKGVQSFSAYQSIETKGNKLKFFRHQIKFHTSNSSMEALEISKIKQVTFKKDLVNDYWATFLVEDNTDLTLPKNNNVIGIDLGLKELIVTSEGEYFENKKFLKNSHYKLLRIQRKFSKSKKGGKNREKLRIKIAKLHRKITKQKEHYYHQVSNKLIRENQTIVMETLRPRNMMKNPKLSRAISDASWGQLTRMLEYKSNWYGRELVKIDQYYPSSKTCSNCGSIKSAIKLTERIYKCEECNFELDRDLNAALNIKKIGIKIPEFKPAENTAIWQVCETGSKRINLKQIQF